MNDILQLDKQMLRERCQQLRLSISQSEAQEAARLVSEHILASVPLSAKVVAAYLPIRGELDIRSACGVLAQRGHRLCLPIITGKGKPLIFREWRMDEPLVQGRYGIAVPQETQPLLEPDFSLVPLLAFDEEGRRLGYGAGYYDYTIHAARARKPDAFFMGVAFDVQKMKQVPAGPYDESLDAVVTESGVVRCT